jgi:hypothetical protein
MRRETIWEGLDRVRIPNGMIRIQNVYDHCLRALQVANEYSEWFEMKRGVRQQCSITSII